MKKMIAALLALSLALTLCACGAKKTETAEATPTATAEPAPSATPTPTPKPTQTPEPTPTEPLYRSQFNGSPLDAPDNTRPFAVMINNINVAQPQCGVSDADIVYEVLAEGGITRMMAIFSHIKDAGTIGSMRSIRTYYVDIAMSYGAVAVHAGYSMQAHERITSNGVNNIDGVTGSYASGTFWRDKSRQKYGVEHSLFTAGDKLWSCAESLGYKLTVDDGYETGLSFADNGTPASGEAANTVEVNFAGAKKTDFTYDPATALYSGAQYGSAYIDGNTGNTMTFTNLMVLKADTKTIDSYGRLDVNLTGSGSGYFVCGGKYVPITWARAGLQDHFTYALEDGTPLTLGAGKTYIAIVPTGTGTATFG